MAPKRDYCCCCIPLRLAVFIISVIAMTLGALSLWNGMDESKGDQSSRIAAYVSTVVYGILGVSGLLCVVYQTSALARNFSILWWVVTVAMVALSIFNLIFAEVSSKDFIRAVCQQQLLSTGQYGSGNVDEGQLSNGVDACYRTVMMMGGIALAVQLSVMTLCGWVASRYTREIKRQHDEDQQQQQVGYADPFVQKA